MPSTTIASTTLPPVADLEPGTRPQQDQQERLAAFGARVAAPAALTLYPLAVQAAPLEALGAEGTPLAGYFRLFTPLVEALLGDNPTLVHWLHPVNMLIVLGAMGGYGTYLGWDIRRRRLGGQPPPPPGLLGVSHPTLMGLMAFLFFLGAQGGLLFTLYEGRPLLASSHSTTAVAALLLLAAQAGVGLTMRRDDLRRTVHAYLGTAIMALLLLHAALGLQLALST